MPHGGGRGAGRVGDQAYTPADSHSCSACPHPASGGASTGSGNVLINHLPAVRVGDEGSHGSCCDAQSWRAVSGAPTVLINDQPVHRIGDRSQHCGGRGRLIEGSANVIVGNFGSRSAEHPDGVVLLLADPNPLDGNST